ncbi:MAG: hypothetical protein FWF22_09175, partial [Treponema sp.]|nr:hypothetical protein [Treponema sp.]
LIFIYRREIAAAYTQISKRQTFWITIALLVVIAAGLILRLNGYVRHSGWSDELYSALRAGNPNYPLIATFMDSGNPPFISCC